ncbi:DUF6080 domain-containing protein [Prevotella sp. oral taxon 317]|uniref:DUF6080 domain-containing protein n=1 Tax=Prevotella sp. oral taxon 317 TaxID=652721 RepID=UPI0001C3F903|nr:DUF6080 domain-containing protein [Prevotella sp. oral taxon 317]EFC67877.1 hypothetical protein HMPREF0670_01928 [Prevotella sp. oral taxon 317 str. F0108]
MLKLRKEEKPLALVAFLVFALQNALTLYKYHDLFTRVGFRGYWVLFHEMFHVSGYDAYSCIYLSNGKIYYELSRHPLFGPLLAPFYWLNDAIIKQFDFNAASYIMAVLLTLSATLSAVLLFRILRSQIGLKLADALALTALLFSFASIMLAVMLPDHFCFSLLLLILTLYIANKGKAMAWWQTALLLLFTAGITLSNGAKTLLADLFGTGKAFFKPRRLLLAGVLPLVVLGAAFYAQYTLQLLPREQESARIEAQVQKKNPNAIKRSVAHEARKERIIGKPMGNDPVLKWTDKDTPRLTSVVENVFGESIQLHRDHLLEDLFISRPVVVHYEHWFFYAVEAFVVVLFVAGLLCGMRQRLLWLCLSWLGVDIFLHIILGFGLNEAYIMGTHWLFIIPIAIAFMFKRMSAKPALVLRWAIVALALYLYVYNARLVFQFMSHPLTIG